MMSNQAVQPDVGRSGVIPCIPLVLARHTRVCLEL